MATGGNQGMVASGNQRLGPATSTSAVGMKLLDHINPPHTPQGVSVGMHSTVQTGAFYLYYIEFETLDHLECVR